MSNHLQAVGFGALVSGVGSTWVPWFVVGTLAVLVSLLVFVAALVFCNRGEPTRRVIALVRAVKAPSSPPGAATAHGRSHPATRSLGAGRGQLCWPSPCTPDPSPRAGVAAATGHTPRGRWPPLALAARVSSPRVRDRTRCLRAAWVNRINTHH